jgi:hypothetical protein
MRHCAQQAAGADRATLANESLLLACLARKGTGNTHAAAQPQVLGGLVQQNLLRATDTPTYQGLEADAPKESSAPTHGKMS